MKLKHLKISTSLSLGFGLILFLVMILGAISILQTKRLWQNTDDLYNHPLEVGRSVRDIETKILQIHVIMKDIAFADGLSENQINRYETEINSYEAELYKLFDIVYERYLGSKSEIDTVYEDIREWKPLRDTVIAIRLKRGRLDSSLESNAVNVPFVRRMLAATEKMIAFSNDKSIQFYSQAEIQKTSLGRKLLIINIIILISSGFILLFLIRTITRPLKLLSEIADRFRQGDYNARSDYDSSNEIGTLASSFNRMAMSVQNNIGINEAVASVSKMMMNENELHPFCKKLLNILLTMTDSQVAAIYILNKGNRLFEHFESIGLTVNKIASFSSLSLEGEFGSVLNEKKIVRLTEIPDDTQFVFSAVAGSFKPKEIISIPLLDGEEVIAVISLASIKNYSEFSIHLINDLWITMTARIIGVLSFQKISDFSEKLEFQNIELEQKSKEMAMQADELKEYNIELELQKRQLDEANRLKSAFLSNMSHELRTPLNSVIALSGVLNRRLHGKISEDEYNYIGIIERNGKNLLLLINDILDISRIEAGKEELLYSQFSVNDLVDDILKSLNPIIAEKGISADYIAPHQLPLIISDKNKCHHIMQNIISNAVKFTEKGSVSISVSTANDEINIYVKDTGIGIAEEFIPYIFDEFRQADDKASRKFGGTGLGMAIAKKYCDMLNGTINVVSKPGEGSVFTVVLPVKPEGIEFTDDFHQDQTRGVPSDATFKINDNAETLKTLLIVEDSEPQIIQLKDILGEAGYILNIARNGREALDSINIKSPDAMILDLQMPDVDGFEVLREIRNLMDIKAFPVLILTAKHITKADLSFLKENNIHQLIQKGSLNKIELLQHIKNIFIYNEKDGKQKTVARQSTRKPESKPRILVIEDNADNLITIKALLEQNYLLSFAEDGYTGVKLFISEKPDLVLLDISLPGNDGFMVLDEIRKYANRSGVPVIALTARAMKGDRESLLAYGFDGYISKPIDNEIFEKTIIDHLNSGHK